ncbi:glycosyltransferase [Sinorhizobium medicae]|uniref:glycosyltransferase family 4 protein n=1 Tax=Sinorhizobium medicae TaxID=110321 RepID=UPI000FD83EAB|nr:glycosyltransferase family 4 protein [Sinorhizobium medicae]MDX0600967.1 glycosyltransferase [Sinorhizobium medicae]MDX0817143.1 glycosyltransferase [Sinorhizobium medicae]MDX0860187.1 glycosyltransferase [Sinorhizobium medicae]RVJ22327.1 glycosyltransferase family 1 protein [Sinorhizobium medicae]
MTLVEKVPRAEAEHIAEGSAGRGSAARFPQQKRVIAVVASLTASLVIFRLELLKRLVAAGHDVIAFAPEHDARVEQELAQIGVRFIRIPMARTGLNPLEDLRTFWALRRHFSRLKPDIVLPYTMKPIIYAGIAARTLGIRERCFLVTGLGHIFSEAAGASLKVKAIRHLCVRLYRTALRGARVVFVYNDADENDIRRYRMLSGHLSPTMISGSGVDLDHFAFSTPPRGGPTFLMVARLLRDKGVVEYVEAARIVRRSFPNARFQLLGHFDSNPTAISREEIDAWGREGILDYLGTTVDVRPYLAACNAFVLPSYYREGIPRSILEALATGRPVITTDLPGCRDTVQPGKNGLVVKARDVAALAEAMTTVAKNPDLAEEMGRRSRELAETRFDVHMINRMLFDGMHLTD